MALKAKFVAGGSVSPSIVVHLTFPQFDARRHMLAAVGEVTFTDSKDTRRLPFNPLRPIYFKAGEEVELEGEIDRQLQNAIKVSDAQLVEAGSQKPGLVKSVAAAKAKKPKASDK
jgi:hypothetical protein